MKTKMTKFNEENMQNAFENFKEIEDALYYKAGDTFETSYGLYFRRYTHGSEKNYCCINDATEIVRKNLNNTIRKNKIYF